MDVLFGVMIGVIVLTVLVVIHELGHAIVARRHGVVVEEFGIGFPPRAWGKKIARSFLGRDVTYSINWLPLGGFVKLQGEHDAATKKGDYGAVTFWQKTQILLAGVAMNWLTAAVLLSILALFGLPKALPDQFVVAGDTTIVREPVQVTYVLADSPAAQAGIRPGDRVISLGGTPIQTTEAVKEIAQEQRGRKVPLEYRRDNQQYIVDVALNDTNQNQKGYLGVSSAQQERIKATWSAPIVGVMTTVQLTGATLDGIGALIGSGVQGIGARLTGDHSAQQAADDRLAQAGDGVAGPIGIFGQVFPSANKAGPLYVVFVAAIISLSLAVMNILPIPALDGGRWFVTAFYRVRRKQLNKETEEKIHGTGFMLLMLLVIIVTISDVGKLAK